jgi:FAD/FMN-containing dehydrogenase
MNSPRVAAVALLSTSAALITVHVAIRKKRQKAAWERQVLDDEEDQRKQALQKLEASDFFRDTSTFETFKNAVGGMTVISPFDKDLYHECRRRAFNENQRGFPLVIVRTQTARAVAECVKYVRRIGLPLCVMSGGHSSKCMMTGSFVIDLYDMNQAELDLDSLTVQVQGGAYLEEVDKVLESHNLGCVVGTYPKTGVGGLVLGGGYGWLARLYGMAVDNLLECEVVLADGKIVIAKEQNEYEDLFWGLRGGSGNFGIVTKFKFRVHRLPTHCLSGSIVYLAPTLAAATQVASNFDKLSQNMPTEVTSLMVLPGGAPVIPVVTA